MSDRNTVSADRYGYLPIGMDDSTERAGYLTFLTDLLSVTSVVSVLMSSKVES